MTRRLFLALCAFIARKPKKPEPPKKPPPPKVPPKPGTQREAPEDPRSLPVDEHNRYKRPPLTR